MPAFAHTPYDGSKRPFSIGLAPIAFDEWIEPDERLACDLDAKARLFAEKRDVVFRQEPDTEAAGAEVLALLAAHLPRRFPSLYRHAGDRIDILAAGRSVALDGPEPALMRAASLVQEDLVLMRAGGEGGHRLVAAALCFPSAWSLADKFGSSLDGLHQHVPGYPGQFALRMQRIFDGLKPEIPVARLNWSIYPDAELHHPESKERPRDWFGADREAFIRVERQTLRRLPATGDILFTIKILVDPFAAFRSHPEGARLAAGLRQQVLGLDPAQLTYKGLADHRDLVAAELARIAGLAGSEA